MLAKCANPTCSASFRHLQDGRLFRLETDQTLRSPKAKGAEYFWLCGDCSAGMTLRLAQDGRVMAAGLREAFPNGPKLTLVSLSRENGMFLRSVSFLRRSHPRGT